MDEHNDCGSLTACQTSVMTSLRRDPCRKREGYARGPTALGTLGTLGMLTWSLYSGAHQTEAFRPFNKLAVKASLVVLHLKIVNKEH